MNKENLLIGSLAVFVGLSTILFLKNKKMGIKYQRNFTEALNHLNRSTISDELWMRPVPIDKVDDYGNQLNWADCKFDVLIVFSEKGGCSACLQLEAAAWQAFLDREGMIGKISVKLVCTVGDIERKQQEFNAMHIRYPVYYDSSASLVKELDIKRTPRIFFLYKGKIVGGYTAEMENREKSKIMMEKFNEFLKLN